MSSPQRLVRSQSALRRLRTLLGRKQARPRPAWSGAAKPLTTLQEANPSNLPEVWFNSTFPGFEQNKPPDQRNVQLGTSKKESPASSPQMPDALKLTSAHL